MTRSIIFALSILFLGCASTNSASKHKAQLHLELGTSYLSRGEYPAALAELLKAETLDADNPVIQNHLGIAYYVRGKMDSAEEHLRKALRLASSYTEARNNLARILMDQNRLDEAAKLLAVSEKDLTYLEPEKTYLNLGLLDFKRQRYQQALGQFKKSLELKRNNCSSGYYYGRSLYELRRYDLAALALDQAIEWCRDSGFEEPLYYSALTYYSLGDRDRVRARVNELTKLKPESAYVDKAQALLSLIK